MSQSGETASTETLLEHAEWVRHLATQLVHGEDRDDALQDSWLAVLRSPPDANRPPRPWLARVLQNAARKRFRNDSRRRALEEKAAALTDQMPTPEQIVERAEVHRLLVDLVLALDEPFRRVVLLRYFEGLSSAEIARALEIPPGTVRWRLKEGIERLRASLDAEHQGDRQAWGLLVAPIAFPPTGNWAPMGVAVMATKTKVVMVGGLVLLAGAFAFVSPHCGESGAPTMALGEERGSAANPGQARPPRGQSDDSVAVIHDSGPFALPAMRAVELAAFDSGTTPRDVAASPGTAALPASQQAPHMAPSDGGVRYPVDREGIRAAVKAALPEMRDCYEEWLKAQPTLGGRVRATFTIDTDDGVDGKVEGVSLGDAGMGHFAMEGCILSAFQDLRFEAPMEGPINVTYPLAFASSSDGGS